MAEYHNIEPLYDKKSRILILGSFPSVKSREEQFFYAHPQNRFWRVMAALTENEIPKTVEEKKTLLLNSKIAVWDVIKSCDITGSGDSSIKNVVPNDITDILKTGNIRAIYCNGQTSYKLYGRYIEPKTHIKATVLPSTSPANAAYSLGKLMEKWEVIKEKL